MYRCVHERLGWVRAIKVIHDPDLMDSIVEEARVVSELSHPNIVHLYDLDHRATPPYAVFEFVDGTDLAKRLRQGPVPWQEALRIATEVLAALACAHGHGVIHRDVKPSNILLARDGAVKLSDFGLGRIAELHARLRVSRQSAPAAPPSQMQQSRQSEAPEAPRMGAGTPFYMSPQQRRGEEPQAADDIYSLGVVLYEALTGYLPEGAWPAPSEVAEVPEALDEVVRRALALQREDRFASAEEMRAALLNLNVPMVTCPECGAQRPEDAEDQFTCYQCGREHLCTLHRDAATGRCKACQLDLELGVRRKADAARLLERAGNCEDVEARLALLRQALGLVPDDAEIAASLHAAYSSQRLPQTGRGEQPVRLAGSYVGPPPVPVVPVAASASGIPTAWLIGCAILVLVVFVCGVVVLVVVDQLIQSEWSSAALQDVNQTEPGSLVVREPAVPPSVSSVSTGAGRGGTSLVNSEAPAEAVAVVQEMFRAWARGDVGGVTSQMTATLRDALSGDDSPFATKYEQISVEFTAEERVSNTQWTFTIEETYRASSGDDAQVTVYEVEVTDQGGSAGWKVSDMDKIEDR